MRVVMVEVAAIPPPGMLNLHCMSPAGGRSTVGHVVIGGDTAEVIASDLARRIVSDRQWCPGCFEATASGNRIMIICRDEVANVLISGDPGSNVLQFSEFGK